METGFIAIGTLIVVQLVSFAYGYGKLNQKVKNVCDRLNDLTHRIEKLEGNPTQKNFKTARFKS